MKHGVVFWQRVRTEEGPVLQTSLEEFTLLALEHLPQAVLIAGHDGQVIFRSAAASSLLSDGLDVMGSIRTEHGALINWPQEISNLDISAGGGYTTAFSGGSRHRRRLLHLSKSPAILRR